MNQKQNNNHNEKSNVNFLVALASSLTIMAADSPKYGQLKGRILDNEKNPLPGGGGYH